MSPGHVPDADLVRRLPLPLAQLYRRAHNAKTPLDRHLTALALWEAALKLLGSTAVVTYAERPDRVPELTEALSRLARPTMGDWWKFIRLLLPLLADRGDDGFRAVRGFILGRTRDDLPRAAGLDATLRKALEGSSGSRVTLRVSDLFDRLVNYRNRVLGHGSPAQRSAEFHERLSRAILAAMAELLCRIDVLAGRILVYVADVRRQPSGLWLIERHELIGETDRRLEPLEVDGFDPVRMPKPGRVYLETPSGDGSGATSLTELHPLVLYDAEPGELFFLNARRGRQKGLYLGYSSGRELELPDLGGEHRELLARVLGLEVDARQVEQWAAASVASERYPAEPENTPGRTVGEFELLSKLGQGGMGVVYRAVQPSVDRHVALKCLLRTGDSRSEARFAREIRALGRVDHPNLVKIYTSGSHGDEWFYAMELVEGATLAAVGEALQARGGSVADLDKTSLRESLTAVIQQTREAEKPLGTASVSASRPVRNDGRDTAHATRRGYVCWVVELVRQAAEAAHALHEAGVVHRDIKPGNIMVSTGGGLAVLMDLGLAQLADEMDGKLTRTRQFVGTLRYASPEQVLAVDRLDRRSDVYSLGATLWEMLTLRPLFGATDETPTPGLMKDIQYTEPEHTRVYHPGIPADLDAIVMKCLEKSSARRYATARELADDLGRFLGGEAVVARPVPAIVRGLKRLARRPAAVGLMIGYSLLPIAIGGLWWGTRGGVTDAGRHAVPRARDIAASSKSAGLPGVHLEPKGGALNPPAPLQGPGESTLPMAFSPDGATLVTGDSEPVARVWDAATGKERFSLVGHKGPVTSASFSGDGKVIATASEDRTVKLWKSATGEESGTLQGHSDKVWTVAFAPGGTILASGGEDQEARLWDLATSATLFRLQGHSWPVFSVSFSPDGQTLATGSGDGTVKLWSTSTGQLRNTMPGNGRGTKSVMFSPDGQFLASGGVDRLVVIRPLDGKSNPVWLAGHSGTVNSIIFSAQGHVLASASDDGSVRLWNWRTGTPITTIQRNRADGIVAAAFAPDGKKLALIDRSGGLVLRDLSPAEVGTAEAKVVEIPSGPVQRVAVRSVGTVVQANLPTTPAGGDSQRPAGPESSPMSDDPAEPVPTPPPSDKIQKVDLEKLLASPATYNNQFVELTKLFCLAEVSLVHPDGSITVPVIESNLDFQRNAAQVVYFKDNVLGLDGRLADSLVAAGKLIRTSGPAPTAPKWDDEVAILTLRVTKRMGGQPQQYAVNIVRIELLTGFNSKPVKKGFKKGGTLSFTFYTTTFSPDGKQAGEGNPQEWQRNTRLWHIVNQIQKTYATLVRAQRDAEWNALSAQMEAVAAQSVRAAARQDAALKAERARVMQGPSGK